MTGALYIIATPIGNLEDISARALAALKSAETILCEDTRVTKKLLGRYAITAPMLSYHQHSSRSRVESIIEKLRAGATLALVTDAGTPGISDPGGKLVSEITQALPDAGIIPIPGPSALMAALSVSGFAADSFVFLGFPPHKKGRETWFRQLTEEERVVVFYESVHRIGNALGRIAALAPERRLVVARELTKKFESVYRGTAGEVLEQLLGDAVKGEFVVVVDRNTNNQTSNTKKTPNNQ